MEARRDVFQAIADPTRREIINLITHEHLTPNSIAENFDVTRQAISPHIKILMECGLITIKQEGRERYYRAKLDKLNEVSEWVQQYRRFWDIKFNSLDKYLNKINTKNKSIKK
ncbi:MAG: metalloregulator ArsR/SmtB family transcription factor [Ferruginibacter sp.]